MKPHRSTITSVSGFLSKVPINSYFRGESQDYGSTRNTATLFRSVTSKPYSIRDVPTEVSYFFNSRGYYQMADRLYVEMPSHSAIIENNFMAYAQHHELPTPLLDISTSPLVALYFACQESLTADEKSRGLPEPAGYVYTYKEDKFVQLGNQLLSFSNQHNNLNPYNFEAIDNTIGKIADSLTNHPINDYFRGSFLRDLQNYLRQGISFRSRILSENNHDTSNRTKPNDWQDELLRIKDNKLLANDLHDLLLSDKTDIGSRFLRFVQSQYPEESDPKYVAKYRAMNIPFLLRFFLELTGTIIYGGGPFIPNVAFVISPTVKFDRIRPQQGKFIYQVSSESSFYYIDPTRSDPFIIRRGKHSLGKPIPIDYTIQIKGSAKATILEQLDTYGINQGSLFMDTDNIAESIKTKATHEMDNDVPFRNS